jgi:hypothetical protein
MNLFRSLGLALAVAAAGCGADGVSVPDTGDPTTTRKDVGAQQNVAATTLAAIGRNATVDVTVDWGVSGNNFDVYVTEASCLELSALDIGACLALVEATSPTAKPERLSFAAQPDSSYKVFVVNRGAVDDTVSVSVSIH